MGLKTTSFYNLSFVDTIFLCRKKEKQIIFITFGYIFFKLEIKKF